MADAAFRILRPAAASRFVLFCDHASNRIPEDLAGLGLPPAELVRHIAWDIGAAGVTEALSEILDATAVLSNTSRLVIDCNRQLDSSGLIPTVSDETRIPGNENLSAEARTARLASWFHPYHDAIETVLRQRELRGVETIPLSIHSMTPSLAGVVRPWPMALSSRGDRRFSDEVLQKLREPGDVLIGDNEPYDLDPAIDYTIPIHALSRGWQYLQVEFRQDVLTDAAAQRRWAERLARALPGR